MANSRLTEIRESSPSAESATDIETRFKKARDFFYKEKEFIGKRVRRLVDPLDPHNTIGVNFHLELFTDPDFFDSLDADIQGVINIEIIRDAIKDAQTLTAISQEEPNASITIVDIRVERTIQILEAFFESARFEDILATENLALKSTNKKIPLTTKRDILGRLCEKYPMVCFYLELIDKIALYLAQNPIPNFWEEANLTWNESDAHLLFAGIIGLAQAYISQDSLHIKKTLLKKGISPKNIETECAEYIHYENEFFFERTRSKSIEINIISPKNGHPFDNKEKKRIQHMLRDLVWHYATMVFGKTGAYEEYDAPELIEFALYFGAQKAWRLHQDVQISLPQRQSE